MKRKVPARRNPVARSLRLLKSRKIASVKAYRRRAKHKARPDHNGQDGLFIFDSGAFPTRRRYSAASGRARRRSMISAAAAGILVPGP